MSTVTDTTNLKDKHVILYHAKCWDGATAAWCAWHKFKPNAICIPVNYGEKPPTLDYSEVRHLWILDFSYPRETLETLAEKCEYRITVLDHHKTAKEQLKGLNYACFADNLSGAGMAWYTFFEDYTFRGLEKAKHTKYRPNTYYELPCKPMPKFVYFAQDYDLWSFKDKDTEAYRIALDQYLPSVEVVNRVFNAQSRPNSPFNVDNLIRVGKSLISYRDKLVKDLAAGAFRFKFPGTDLYGFGVISNNPSLSSKLGNVLAEVSRINGDGGYAAIFSLGITALRHGFVGISLRSVGDFDVSALAALNKGGGHRNASGCKWEYNYFLKFMQELGCERRDQN